MVRPISLRLRHAKILAKAHAILEDARLQRRMKFEAYRSLQAARQAYDLEEKTRFMSESEQKRWRERRKLVEAELRRITKLGPS